MQIKRILLILVMITILTSSASIQSSYGSAGTGDEDKISVVQEEVSQTKFSEFQDILQKFVLFTMNEQDYHELKNLGSVSQVFPGLEALIIESTTSDLLKLQKDYEFYFEPSYSFSQFYLPDTPFVESSESDVFQLDALIDGQLMNVDHLWSSGYRGENVTIGVFDTGVDFTHPALSGRFGFNQDFNVENGVAYTIPKGHGTFVAGMIAANGTGLGHSNIMGTAPQSKIGGINIGINSAGFLAGDILAGWDWIIQNNASLEIVNTSWGGGGTSWDLIVDKLEDANVLVVGSAGNSGPDYESVGGPGNAIAAISVGATTHSPSIASFSSRGYGSQLTIKPDVVGPGQEVDSIYPNNKYGTSSGTSFSSPAVAGAAAVLISALEANGMDWNPGLIKTALKRGAYSITGSERIEGSGMVDLSASWSYINSLQKSGNLPLGVDITPSNGPVSYLKTLPQDIQIDLTMTLISSMPGNVNLSISGDIANFMTLGNIDPGKQSQVINIATDTSGLVNGVYTGQITANIGNDNVTSTWSITIVDPPIARGAVDVYYPGRNVAMDVGVGSSSTGKIIQEALTRGIWIENLNQPASLSVLNQYDFYWTAEASGYVYDDAWSAYDTSNLLTESEMNEIVAYVENGGDLIFNMEGKYLADIGDRYLGDGTNLNVYNKLLANFGIQGGQTPTIYPFPPSFWELPVTSIVEDVGSLTDGVREVMHAGHYLNITNKERVQIIARDKYNPDLVTMASYASELGGRVFVSTGRSLISENSAFYDNNGYFNDENYQNKLFADNIVDWVASSDKINRLTDSITPGKISGSFQILENGIASSDTNVTLLSNEYVVGGPLELTDEGNGIFSFEVETQSDGLYEVIAEFKGETIKWRHIVDTTPPTIDPFESNLYDAVFEPDESILLQFEVFDLFSEITKSDIQMTLDEDLIRFSDIKFDSETSTLSYLIQGSKSIERTDPYDLNIIVTDHFGNVAEYDYRFWIGEGPPPSSIGNSAFSPLLIVFSTILIMPLLRSKYSKYSRL